MSHRDPVAFSPPNGAGYNIPGAFAARREKLALQQWRPTGYGGREPASDTIRGTQPLRHTSDVAADPCRDEGPAYIVMLIFLDRNRLGGTSNRELVPVGHHAC